VICHGLIADGLVQTIELFGERPGFTEPLDWLIPGPSSQIAVTQAGPPFLSRVEAKEKRIQEWVRDARIGPIINSETAVTNSDVPAVEIAVDERVRHAVIGQPTANRPKNRRLSMQPVVSDRVQVSDRQWIGDQWLDLLHESIEATIDASDSQQVAKPTDRVDLKLTVRR
jgi:hypothetical protein